MDFKKGDRVRLDPEIVHPLAQRGGMAWTEIATVHNPDMSRRGSLGLGKNSQTDHAVGIRFDNYDYAEVGDEKETTNCHTVADNRISLDIGEEEIYAAIASIQDSFRSHS